MNDLGSLEPGQTVFRTWDDRSRAALAILAGCQALDVKVNACPERDCKTGCGNAQCRAKKGDQAGGLIASIEWCRQCVAKD